LDIHGAHKPAGRGKVTASMYMYLSEGW